MPIGQVHTIVNHSSVETNQLLAALPQEGFRKLVPHMTPIRFGKNDILYEAGRFITTDVYLLSSGLVSLVSTTESGMAIEVGMVGRDGLIGIQAVLGAPRSDHRAVVQVPGEALMIKINALRAALEENPSLRELLLRYTGELLTQISQRVVCNHFHSVEQRLCRQLLMIQDYTDQDTFELTHESLSQMLGARRTGITKIACRLQKAGFIRYHWGHITIVDRQKLEANACECFRVQLERYKRMPPDNRFSRYKKNAVM